MKKIMFDEVWKDIAEFDGYYQVSNYGRVRRSDNHRIKASSLNAYGHPQVNLYKNGKAYLRRVHRLVAMAFIPNPNNLPMINHKDEVPTNNNVDNLEWCDAKYNVNYGGGNEKRALSHSKPVLQYSLTGQLIKEWHSATEAARELGLEKRPGFLDDRREDIVELARTALKKAYRDGRLTTTFKKGERNYPAGEFKKGQVESPETKAKRSASLKASWDRRKKQEKFRKDYNINNN